MSVASRTVVTGSTYSTQHLESAGLPQTHRYTSRTAVVEVFAPYSRRRWTRITRIPGDSGFTADPRYSDSRNDGTLFDDVPHASELYSGPMTDLAPRITPPLDEINREFWTSGASKELRITRGHSFRRWVFPPSLLCADCGSRAAYETTSGRGKVFTHTTNPH